MTGVRGATGNILGDVDQTIALDVDLLQVNQFRDELVVDGGHQHGFFLAAENHCLNPVGELGDRKDATGMVMDNRHSHVGHIFLSVARQLVSSLRANSTSAISHEIGRVSTFCRTNALHVSNDRLLVMEIRYACVKSTC
jgi:hypothetical protein